MKAHLKKLKGFDDHRVKCLLFTGLVAAVLACVSIGLSQKMIGFVILLFTGATIFAACVVGCGMLYQDEAELDGYVCNNPDSSLPGNIKAVENKNNVDILEHEDNDVEEIEIDNAKQTKQKYQLKIH